MKINQVLIESAGATVAFAFGRFNPAHQGHIEVWRAVEDAGANWFVGTNPNTIGPNDPLTFEQKSAWMAEIYPPISGHIVAQTSVLTLAAYIFKKLRKNERATVAYITDATDWAWSGKLLNQYNGVEGSHGYYKFAQIVHQPSPRVSSATALRDAARANDRVAFYDASGTDPKLTVDGLSYFDTVKQACEKYPLPVKRGQKVKESILNEGREEKYQGFTIKSYTNKAGISKAWVGDAKGNPDPKLLKVFPEVQANNEDETISLQKQKIDDFYNKRDTKSKTSTYSYSGLNAIFIKGMLGKRDDGPIYIKLQDQTLYISENPVEGFIKLTVGTRDDATFKNLANISNTTIANAGLKPGTRYEISPINVSGEIKSYKLTKHSDIIGGAGGERVNAPLFTIQLTGRNSQSENVNRDVSEDDEAGEVKKQGQLIPWPAGTTKVHVSDVYDWYKLGMVISDLDDADPKMFGQGAPQTIIAFGSEEEESKLLPLLKRLGLKVDDIDPEGADLDEAYHAGAVYEYLKKSKNQSMAETDSPAVAHTAKNLENPPKVMQHRAKRDIQRDKQWWDSQIAARDTSHDDEWAEPKSKGSVKENASRMISAHDKNGFITVIIQAPDGTKKAITNDNPRYINQWLMRYDLQLPPSITNKFKQFSLNEFAPSDDSHGDEKSYLLQLADDLFQAIYIAKNKMAVKAVKDKIAAAGGDVKIVWNNNGSFNVVMYHPVHFKQGHLVSLVGDSDSQRMGESTNVQGPVEAWGYRYNERDQRVMWRLNFDSEQAAHKWADSKNATIVEIRPVKQLAEEEQKTVAKTWDQMTPQEKSSGVKGRTVWNEKTQRYYTVFDVPVNDKEVDEAASLKTMRDFFAGDKNARDPFEITKQRMHFIQSQDPEDAPTTDMRFRNREEYEQWLEQNKLKKIAGPVVPPNDKIHQLQGPKNKSK